MPLTIGITSVTTTIANGTSMSSPIALGAQMLVGITMPAAWDAAGLTFRGSVDGGSTFQDVYTSSGVELLVSAGAGHYLALDPTLFQGMNEMEIRSGTGASPVNQTADRQLILTTKSFVF